MEGIVVDEYGATAALVVPKIPLPSKGKDCIIGTLLVEEKVDKVVDDDNDDDCELPIDVPKHLCCICGDRRSHSDNRNLVEGANMVGVSKRLVKKNQRRRI